MPENIRERFKRLTISEDILKAQTIITADTGFANEKNMQYLHDDEINAYIPDNQFRSRDPKFSEQKVKHGKRHQDKKTRKKKVFPANEFQFDPTTNTCVCPAGQIISFRGIKKTTKGLKPPSSKAGYYNAEIVIKNTNACTTPAPPTIVKAQGDKSPLG